MPGYLQDKVLFVTGNGTPEHRAVAVALAEAGADVAVAGPADPAHEVLLNSIANEVWAIGRRSLAVGYDGSDPASFAAALEKARADLGRVDLVIRAEPVAAV